MCSWYKTDSKSGNLAGVRYVSVLGIQFRPVTMSFEAFSGHKTMMYTLKVELTILNNLIRDCHFIINGRVELLVEYTLRRLRSKILYFIPRCHGETRKLYVRRQPVDLSTLPYTFLKFGAKYFYQLILVNFCLLLSSTMNHLLYLFKTVLLPVSSMSKT